MQRLQLQSGRLAQAQVVGGARSSPFRSGIPSCLRQQRRARPLVQPVRAVEQKEEQKRKAPDAPPPPSGPNKPSNQTERNLDVVIAELKASGMTREKANKLLSAWSKSGVEDPEQLRKLLVKKSLAPLSGALLQMVIDGIASFGGFYLSYLVSQSGDFPFKIVLELAGNFAGIYYFINVLLEASVAAAILYSTYRYGTSASEVLVAVKQLAGPASGLTIVDKAAAVTNTLKVLQALEEVAKLLQAEFGEQDTKTSGSARDSLRNLSALLTLARAKEDLGFSPEAFGLSEKQAANIALAFSTYDTNDSNTLDLTELGNLCTSLGWTLNQDELKEAFKTLDTDKNGSISFTEFVSWFTMRCPLDKRQT